MQNDEMIWQIVNHQFCSFKTTIGKALSDKTHFCRHPFSVTGLCNRTSCPLANSKYATLRESHGRIHLCIKSVERAHSPKNLWENILLSKNYGKALAQIDEHLAHFPKTLIHRNKQRLTKIHQYIIRMRKIELKQRSGRKAKTVRVHRKIEQREERRERKALVAAKLERSIEMELIERLAKGTYGDIYNFPEMAYQKALDSAEEKQAQSESDSDIEEQRDADMNLEYMEDFETEDENEDDSEHDMEDMLYLGNGEWRTGIRDEDHDSNSYDSDELRKTNLATRDSQDESKQRGPHIEIEYEEEVEDTGREGEAVTEIAW